MQARRSSSRKESNKKGTFVFGNDDFVKMRDDLNADGVVSVGGQGQLIQRANRLEIKIPHQNVTVQPALQERNVN